MPVGTIVAIGSLIVAVIAIIFTILSFRRTANHDLTAGAIENATMTADIRYIRNSIDEIKLENRGMKKDLDDIKTRVVVVEQSVESAHKRLDDMKKATA